VNYSETEEKVIAVVSNTLNVKNIDLQSSQENTSEWDSLAYLSLISAMEEEFEIEITEKNINNFGSVKNILNEINHL
jgi:acyl carrier protein